MTNWVQAHGSEVDWVRGVYFSHAKNGESDLVWEVAEVLPDNHVRLTLPKDNNQSSYILGKYPIGALKKATFWFKEDTIQKLDPMMRIINKIKYLDKRFLDRQQKKVLA